MLWGNWYTSGKCRDANINVQKTGRIQTENMEVFKITCNFDGTKLARNREVAKFSVNTDNNVFKNGGNHLK